MLPTPTVLTLRVLAACAVLCRFATHALAIPAFPGAEGYGANATGGRGGDVYHVTNLNTSGAGSFADAIATVPGAGRTIVFDVSGHIHVNKTTLSKSNVTIAGQTAPGDGIGFKDGTFIISGDDIIIRHVRFRYGDKAAGGDCIDLSSGTLNAILDQVSIQFSTDENISSFSSPPENLTMQWSLNGWGLESHSCGGLWDQNHASSHHSLWAHNHTRNPKARPNGLLEWINNVTFDWDIGFIMGDSNSNAAWKANVRGCYFLCPPGNLRSKALEKAGLQANGQPNFSLYLDNCLHDADGDGLLNGTDKGYGIASGSYTTAAAPFAGSAVPVTIDAPLLAFKKVLSKAGALRLDVAYAGALRDEVDAKMVNNVATQTRQHISKESSLGLTNGGFGTLNSTTAPTDTDKDGMPDFYETALGWTVAAQDHNTALASSGGVITGTTFFPAGTVAGYTRLEEYLHFLAIPHGTVKKNVAGAATSIVVNMAKFTGGFTAAPAFTVANITGGTIALSGAGNAIATFTPTLDYVGRARFDFTVTDSAGSAWTQTCALLVSASGTPRTVKWLGDGSANVWAPGVANWTYNGAATAAGNDYLLFDDTGSQSPVVSVPSGVGNVFAGLTVNAAGNYTISAPTAGYLIGPLTKRGTGTLTLATTGTSSLHPTLLEEGTLAVATGVGLGAGDLTLAGGTLALGMNLSTATVATAGTSGISVTGTYAVSGTWSGAGTVNLAIGNNTFSLTGNTGAFGGTFALGASTGFFRFNGALGSAAATFDLGTATADLINRNGNATFDLGALSGGSGTTLAGASSVNAPSTYNIGANGSDTTFAGSIANGGAGGVTNIVKLGPGALTLTGTSTHTGTTTVSAGDLVVNGALGATAVTVAGGAVLRGAGAFGGSVTTQTGAEISPGAGRGQIGTLTAAGGLTATSTIFSMQLSSSPAGVNDKISITGGSGLVSGTNVFDISFADGVLGAGDYRLIECAAGIPLNIGGGMVMNLTTDAPAGTRQTFALNRTASGTTGGSIQLVVTGSTANLTWVGALNSAAWDLNTTANFSGAAPGTFYNFDSIIFDDTTANRTVTLTGSLAPRVATVNTAAGYTLGGAGTLDGTGALVKNGAGTLTVNNTGASTFSGGTTINGGVIALASATANASGLGTGAVVLNGTALTMFSAGNGTFAGTLPNEIAVSTTGTLNAAPRCGFSGAVTGSGVLTYYTPYVRADITGDWSAFSGRVNVTTDGDGGDFRIASGYGWPGLGLASVNLADRVSFYFNGTLASGAGTFIEIGELSGSPLATLLGGATGGRNFTYTIGAKTAPGMEAIYTGAIAEQNTGTATSYVKTGAGTWTLAGTCHWNGRTSVEQGTLKITGSVTCGAASVASLAALNLASGSLATDALAIATGATFSASGKATLTGDFNNDGTATIAGGTFAVTGDVVNNGTLRFNGGAALAATGAFVNNGLLDLLTSPSSLPANFENHGIVLDRGLVKVTGVVKSGNTVTIAIASYTAHTYQLTRGDSLAGPWNPVGTVQNGAHIVNGDGSFSPTTLTFTDSGATGTQRFYRVSVGP